MSEMTQNNITPKQRDAEYYRQYRKRNPEANKEACKRWRQKHVEKYQAQLERQRLKREQEKQEKLRLKKQAQLYKIAVVVTCAISIWLLVILWR